jgi:hypothetical protein
MDIKEKKVVTITKESTRPTQPELKYITNRSVIPKLKRLKSEEKTPYIIGFSSSLQISSLSVIKA